MLSFVFGLFHLAKSIYNFCFLDILIDVLWYLFDFNFSND